MPVQLIPKNATREWKIENCRNFAVSGLNKKSKMKGNLGRCYLPRECDSCLCFKISGTIRDIQEALDSPEQPLYILDFSLDQDYENTKRNIRLKKPTLLMYFPHDYGTTLLTTEARYGGKQVTLNDITHDTWVKWVLTRENKRSRIMTQKELKRNNHEGEVKVTVDVFITNAPVAAVNSAGDIAEVIYDASEKQLPIQEKCQAKIDIAADILRKKGYVVQPVRKSFWVEDTPNTTSIESFNIHELKRVWAGSYVEV